MFHRSRRVAGLISTFGLVIAMVGASSLVASASPSLRGISDLVMQGNQSPPDYICHATSSNKNPYVKNDPDIASIVKGQGHDSHNGPLWNATLKGLHVSWGDIIPPFDYDDSAYQGSIYNGSYPGQNYAGLGQQIWANGCQLPEEYWNTTTATVIFRSNGDPLGSPTAGVSVYDTATISHTDSGIEPTGTLSYTFYTNNSCTGAGTAAGEVTLDTGLAGKSSVEASLAAGSYSFRAEYSGDSNYKGSKSPCEPFTVAETPNVIGIVTDPNPKRTSVGGTLKDTAVLSNGVNPTGKITFTLKNPSNVVVFTLDVTVNGNGSYSTPTGFVANASGVWHWQAAYGGDNNNNPVSSNYADEPVTVDPAGGVLAQTAMTTPEQGLAVGLMAFGLFAMMGAFALRRREA